MLLLQVLYVPIMFNHLLGALLYFVLNSVSVAITMLARKSFILSEVQADILGPDSLPSALLGQPDSDGDAI